MADTKKMDGDHTETEEEKKKRLEREKAARDMADKMTDEEKTAAATKKAEETEKGTMSYAASVLIGGLKKHAANMTPEEKQKFAEYHAEMAKMVSVPNTDKSAEDTKPPEADTGAEVFKLAKALAEEQVKNLETKLTEVQTQLQGLLKTTQMRKFTGARDVRIVERSQLNGDVDALEKGAGTANVEMQKQYDDLKKQVEDINNKETTNTSDERRKESAISKMLAMQFKAGQDGMALVK